MSDELIPWEPQYPYEPSNKNKKAMVEYLAMGHGIQEALTLVGITERSFHYWCKFDKDFRYWTGPGLATLKKDKRYDLIAANHLKIAHAIQNDDMNTLEEILKIDYKKRKKSEISILNKLREVYASPTQLKAVKEFANTGNEPEGGLLKLFKKIEKIEVVEGQYKEIDDEVPHLQSSPEEN